MLGPWHTPAAAQPAFICNSLVGCVQQAGLGSLIKPLGFFQPPGTEDMLLFSMSAKSDILGDGPHHVQPARPLGRDTQMEVNECDMSGSGWCSSPLFCFTSGVGGSFR
jgi:hypothetical protein